MSSSALMSWWRARLSKISRIRGALDAVRGFEVDRCDCLRSFEQVVAAFEVRLIVVGAQDLGAGHRGVVGDEWEAAVGDGVVADFLGVDGGGDGEADPARCSG